MTLIERVYFALVDGEWHSGQSMALEFDCTRAAINSTIRSLKSFGLDVHSVKGKGYRVSQSIDVLSANKIRACLDRETVKKIALLDVLFQTTSTSDHLKKTLGQPYPVSICIAEYQTSGRGRSGRRWYSNVGGQILMSLAVSAKQMTWGFSGLSLVIGLSIADALATLNVPVKLKWPNDVIYENKKLGGILVELTGEPNGPCGIIIGVGINLADPPSGEEYRYPPTGLGSKQGSIDRNKLCAALVEHLNADIEKFVAHGWTAFRDRWNHYDFLQGKTLDIHFDGANRSGNYLGLDDQGALLIETSEGLKRFSVGDVNVVWSQ